MARECIQGNLAVMPAMCATCPFRETGLTEYRQLLIERSLALDGDGGSSPICHSTGDGLPEHDIDAKAPALTCRGARDLQLTYFHAIGFLDQPTDEAWDRKCAEMGIAAPGSTVDTQTSGARKRHGSSSRGK